MSELPPGWTVASVEELSGVGGLATDGDWIESKDQDPAGGVRLIQLADIGDGEFRDRSSRFVTEQTVERLRCTYLQAGDLLIARMPDPLGRACVFPRLSRPAITAVDVFIWRAGRAGTADARWLMHSINSPQIRDRIADQAGGTTRQRIAGGRLKQLPLPVPPLPEQRRIVAKIDSLTGKSKRARDHLVHIPRLVEKYKQAILTAAFRGDLIGHSGEVPRTALGDVTVKITKGASPKWQGFAYQTDGILFVRSQNVGWGELLFDDRAFLPASFNQKQRNSIISENDVLLNIVGASIGRSAVATNHLVGANCNQAVAVIRLAKPTYVDARFINLWLATDEAQTAITLGSVDVARANFSLGSIRELNVPWPKASRRKEIVHSIEAAFAWIDRLTADGTSARKLIDHLDQAVLAKAFRGELVPQDPADEPASLLLEHIREERAAAPKPKRGRKKVA